MKQAAAQAALRSALEGAALACVAGGTMAMALRRALLFPALCGLGTAWAVSSTSAAALFFARTVSNRTFWWAYGGGMALRAFVLAVLMAVTWSSSWAVQAAELGSYALGILAILLLEYRHLTLSR